MNEKTALSSIYSDLESCKGWSSRLDLLWKIVVEDLTLERQCTSEFIFREHLLLSMRGTIIVRIFLSFVRLNSTKRSCLRGNGSRCLLTSTERLKKLYQLIRGEFFHQIEIYLFGDEKERTEEIIKIGDEAIEPAGIRSDPFSTIIDNESTMTGPYLHRVIVDIYRQKYSHVHIRIIKRNLVIPSLNDVNYKKNWR